MRRIAIVLLLAQSACSPGDPATMADSSGSEGEGAGSGSSSSSDVESPGEGESGSTDGGASSTGQGAIVASDDGASDDTSTGEINGLCCAEAGHYADACPDGVILVPCCCDLNVDGVGDDVPYCPAGAPTVC